MPPSGVRNSYKNLLLSGKVIVSDDPSPPVTLSATSTALGIVNVCATLVQVISNICTVTQEDISFMKEEHLGKADFIICIKKK